MKDKQEVANQPVKVTLKSVIELQNEITRLQGSQTQKQYVQGMIRAAQILNLPLSADFKTIIGKVS